ncbi:MAG TPA: hypothetical protein VE441_05675, partial [Mycobacterium sp.]|nr:hypothetical protein [Mycobacterium sp.]
MPWSASDTAGFDGSSLAHLDVRLVPAAFTGWTVTAAGIVWPVGRALACCCVVLVAASCALLWAACGHARLRAIG